MKTPVNFRLEKPISDILGRDNGASNLKFTDNKYKIGNDSSYRMNGFLRKTLLALSGQIGINLLSLITLLISLLLTESAGWYFLEMGLGIIVIRFLYLLMADPKPILASYLVRKKTIRVAEDELKVSLALTALAFMMNWPITAVPILIFVFANMILQIALMKLSKKLLGYIARKTPANVNSPKKVLIIGTGQRAKKAANVILDSPELEASLYGFLDYRKNELWRYRDIPLIGHPDEIGNIIASNQVDAVIVAVEPEDLSKTRTLFNVAEKMGVHLCFMAEIFDPEISNVKPASINGTPVFHYSSVPENQFLLFAKNIIDRIGALAGILLSSPILLLIAVAIKLDSRGPIIFKQVRSGLNGRKFNLYKFRTMCLDAERKKAELEKMNEMTGPVFKISNDPRVTRIGKFLRKTSLDEFPQFFNVLKGDMSLVGPRPPLPKEVVNYENWQHRRLSVKPGVTCTWQVSGRNNIDFEEWMKLDLQYIDNWSLWDDTKIIVRTIPAVLKGTGAS